jgi:glycosyltransferase involved in cell wall biosynthesis
VREGLVQIVVPVYNEGDNVVQLYELLRSENVRFDRLRFVYDQDSDTSLPFVKKLAADDSRVEAVKNEYGPGVIRALRFGFDHVEPGPVIVLMGDLSDKLSIVPDMLRLWREGATLVSPSRYMPGGRQHGGGLVKSTLSRLAGLSLGWLGFPTSDPTNNFKLYDADWLKRQRIESEGGFEVALELCYKAYVQREPIRQLPTEWFDRTGGESRFRLRAWLPRYLHWWLRAAGAVVRSRLAGERAR